MWNGKNAMNNEKQNLSIEIQEIEELGTKLYWHTIINESNRVDVWKTDK